MRSSRGREVGKQGDCPSDSGPTRTLFNPQRSDPETALRFHGAECAVFSAFLFADEDVWAGPA